MAASPAFNSCPASSRACFASWTAASAVASASWAAAVAAARSARGASLVASTALNSPSNFVKASSVFCMTMASKPPRAAGSFFVTVPRLSRRLPSTLKGLPASRTCFRACLPALLSALSPFNSSRPCSAAFTFSKSLSVPSTVESAAACASIASLSSRCLVRRASMQALTASSFCALASSRSFTRPSAFASASRRASLSP
mmetsp:Transcript_41092/g.81725  ORF Transcript_41092/g.81725 Transcript_41092/m.81725 type:complete len:200 (+) Transcript_41092:316-915(+)